MSGIYRLLDKLINSALIESSGDSIEFERDYTDGDELRDLIKGMEQRIAVLERALDNLSKDSNSCMNVATQLNVTSDRLKELNKIVVDKYIQQATAELEATNDR